MEFQDFIRGSDGGTDNKILRQENDYLKIKVERWEKEVSEIKRMMEEKESCFRKLLKEKIDCNSALREENKSMQLQMSELELKYYDSKKNLKKLYRIIMDKEEESKKLKLQLTENVDSAKRNLNQTIVDMEAQLTQKMNSFLDNLAYKEGIIANLEVITNCTVYHSYIMFFILIGLDLSTIKHEY